MTKQVAPASKSVEPTKDIRHLAEIGQQNKTEFALCCYDNKTDKLIQCHQFVHCRDFMGDAVVGFLDGRDMAIYGFSYSKTNPRLDQDNTSILIRFPDGDHLKNFSDNFPILKEIEDAMNFDVSYAELVDFPGNDKVVWVLGSKLWQKTSVTFSLYTYLLKCLTYKIKNKAEWMKEIKKQGTVESRYMDEDYFKKLFVEIPELIKKFKSFTGLHNQAKVNIGTIHNYTGFVAQKPIILGTHDRGDWMGSEHDLLKKAA